MNLPFTGSQFLEVFGLYNSALGWAVLLLWATTFVFAALWWWGVLYLDKWLSLLLAFQWLWSGAVYHLVYFSAINPAAYLFGVFFIVQAVLFYWYGAYKGRLHFVAGMAGWNLIGAALVIYSLVYPFLGMILGFQYPRMPSFGVPCPVTLLSAGFLLTTSPPAPRPLLVIPITWTIIAGTAAVLFDVYMDWALFIAGACLVVFLFKSRTGCAEETP
jgi:hypothetical protein